MVSANGGLPAHRYTPQVTPRWPGGSEPASLRYAVRGPMGHRFGGYVVEVCVVPVEVGHLEGRRVRSALVYCLDVDLTISVLVPVGLLFHDVKLEVQEALASRGLCPAQALRFEGVGAHVLAWLPGRHQTYGG